MLKERGDSADIVVESPIFGYTLVADAKVFRMSRTAKNPKDFKINALSGWRKEADFAVLCSPLHQYPKSHSQLYAQALENNVCIISWEHLLFMLKNKVKESSKVTLSPLWDFSRVLSTKTVVADRKRNFINEVNQQFLSIIKGTDTDFNDFLSSQINILRLRGDDEKNYWEKEKDRILKFSKKQAIIELISSMKINEKIKQIEVYIDGLNN